MIDFRDGISAFEYEIMRNDNAGSRVLEAFKQAYWRDRAASPQQLLDSAFRTANVNPLFLSSCERSWLQKEIDSFLSSC